MIKDEKYSYLLCWHSWANYELTWTVTFQTSNVKTLDARSLKTFSLFSSEVLIVKRNLLLKETNWPVQQCPIVAIVFIQDNAAKQRSTNNYSQDGENNCQIFWCDPIVKAIQQDKLITRNKPRMHALRYDNIVNMWSCQRKWFPDKCIWPGHHFGPKR